MLRSGQFLQDRYEILGLIGSGGMSDVYKAKCHTLNRTVAIKVLKEEFSEDDSFIEKFNREAEAAARLSHPNIVQVYDVVNEDRLHFIVMELIEGVTLKDYIARKGFLDYREAIGIAIQVAGGIAAAHEQKIIHRDIKPQNMLMSMDGTVKVADFGIARAVSTQTMTSEAMGSVHYISPEQARGGYCDERSDIYSFGITLYEMVTGRLPFTGDNTVSIALAHLQEQIPSPSAYNPEIPVSLEKIILKCSEKKPERRYDSIRNVIQDLRRVLLHPEEDFVIMAPELNLNGSTIKLSDEQLEEIKKGVRSKELLDEQKAEGNLSENLLKLREQEKEDDTLQEIRNPENRKKPGGARGKETAGSGSSPKKNKTAQPADSREREKHRTGALDHLFTTFSIVLALAVIGVAGFLILQVLGLFQNHIQNSGDESESNPAVVVESTEPAAETTASTQIAMPDVLELPQDLAEAKLKEYTLVMKVSYEHSETVKAGDVIAQEPAEGVIVDKYSSVNVTISEGPAYVHLAELGLAGTGQTSARQALEDKGFTVQIQTEASKDTAAGIVIRLRPEEAKAGDTVTMIVSSGPETVLHEVPDLTGHTEEEALSLLMDNGFFAGTVTQEYHSEIPAGSVISQGIEAGTSMTEGSLIPYVVSLGKKAGRYLAAINEVYDMSSLIGPGALSSDLTVEVRLRQTVDGQTVYKTLMEPTHMKGNSLLPISYTAIEGARGVSEGVIEVINVDTKEVLTGYTVRFVETE